MSIVFFHHYPLKFLCNTVSAAMIVLAIVAWFFISLAFNKGFLVRFVAIYSLIPFAFYAFAFLSRYTGIDIFESLPVDVVNFLNINIYNLTETANKLFVLTAPSCAVVILFSILSSIFTRRVLTSLFDKL